MKKCPYCAEDIQDQAIVCRFCGRDLRTGAHPSTPQPQAFNPGIAALLSLVIPGAGQMYRGEVGAGIIWLVLVVGGYFLFIIPGLVLHLVCVLTAAGKPSQGTTAPQRATRQAAPVVITPELRARHRRQFRNLVIAWVSVVAVVILGLWVAYVVQDRERAAREAAQREDRKEDAPKPPTPSPTPPTYTVKVGALKEKASADLMVTHLKAKGFAAYLMPKESGLFGVGVGKYTDRTAADLVIGKLRHEGLRPFVVIVDSSELSAARPSREGTPTDAGEQARRDIEAMRSAIEAQFEDGACPVVTSAERSNKNQGWHLVCSNGREYLWADRELVRGTGVRGMRVK